jgi:hypothetical protein
MYENTWKTATAKDLEDIGISQRMANRLLQVFNPNYLGETLPLPATSKPLHLGQCGTAPAFYGWASTCMTCSVG